MRPTDLIDKNFRLNPLQKIALRRLKLNTLADLLYYLPVRYGAQAKVKKIKDVVLGEYVSVTGKVLKNTISKSFRSKIPMAEVILEDDSGQIKSVWFHQAYMAKKVPVGGYARITGTTAIRNGKIYFANPEIEATSGIDLASEGSLFPTDEIAIAPVYPESRGITSLWIRHAIGKLLKEKLHEQLNDCIPVELLAEYHLPPLKVALVWIHSPHKQVDADAARKRFAFEEVFLIQLARQMDRRTYRSNPTHIIKIHKEIIHDFISRFSFKLTEAQNKAIQAIIEDVGSGKPMTRLLEGDVGSGKTAVAAVVAFTIISTPPQDNKYGHLQVGYMAPTEILAKQLFNSFIGYFEHTGISIGLLTGSECRKFPSKINQKESTTISKTQLLKWLESGEISIVVGTHAIIQKSVHFKQLGLVIIDEQHRFGVNQRLQLAQKHQQKPIVKRSKSELDPPTTYSLQPTTSLCVPHLLSMTATPIPRTLALTIYGDLDLTLLDQMPAGRKPIITEIVHPAKRNIAYESIRAELKNGRQLYVICPRIDEPDPNMEMALYAKSAKAEAERLKRDVFQEYSIGVVHSKLKPKDKDNVMLRFANGEIDILVATSVVEVGVNVPNATVIIIEGADRFGLAQLHQLRGRVIRSNHQAYCYILAESKSEKTSERLKALRDATNGFELAEKDLILRGSGELTGRKQWGISDIGMEAIKNLKMVEAARSSARKMLELDPELTESAARRHKVEARRSSTHFE